MQDIKIRQTEAGTCLSIDYEHEISGVKETSLQKGNFLLQQKASFFLMQEN